MLGKCSQTNNSHKKKLKAICKHCNEVVTYQQKSERVNAHLSKCTAFLQFMMGIDIECRPVWFNELTPNKKERPEISMKTFLVPKMTALQIKQLNEKIAMHFYTTSTSFIRIEEASLLEAFCICRPDAVLPSRKQLAEKLLDTCFNKVKKVVDERLKKTKNFLCLTTDGWSNIKNESIINYMLGGNGSTFFWKRLPLGKKAIWLILYQTTSFAL